MTRTSLNGLVPGKLIGFTKHGLPVFSQAGGAPADVDDWIPIEYGSEVVQRVLAESAVERFGRPVPMSTRTKEIPRSAGLTVTANTTYSDDASANDSVILKARRHIARFSIDEDDLDDANSLVNVIATKSMDWAISYADEFDNSCLGVSAAESDTPSDLRPYTSLYKALRTTDSDVGYTADTNYLTWDDDNLSISASATGASAYEKFSALFEKVENGKYWNQAEMLVIAHPSFRSVMRLAMDGNGSPIFKESAYIDSATQRPVDTLFTTPIAWSRGARVSATATDNPTGNPLMFYVNRRYMARGDRSGPESQVAAARPQDDTDVTSVKFRVRKGFKLTHPLAASVLERTTN